MARTFASSLIGTAFLLTGLLAQTPGKVDFRRDIRPIFQEHCIGCHGPSQQMGGMRLDRRSSAMAIRGGTIIGPGNSEGSRLYLKLVGAKYGGRMPPTGPLSPELVGLIKSWIDQGAEWPDDLAGEKAATLPDPRAARIMETLRTGDRQKFAQLLRQDSEAVKLKGPGGSTPLMCAALYGDAAALRQIIEQGADVNAANDAGATALMWAIEDPEKVRLLLEHGADANARSVENQTPMKIALGNPGSAAVVKLLLDHGVNLDSKTYRDGTPFAGAGGDEGILHLLIEHGADLTRLSDGLGPALRSDCAACVNMLIPSVSNAKLSSLMILAAGVRDARAFEILLDHGADPKTAMPGLGLTSLMYAADAEVGPADRVKTLIDHGADVNARTADGSTALDFALRSADASVVEALRKAGAKEGDAAPAPRLKPKPAASAGAAIDRSIPLLQRSDVAFLRKTGCVSCHTNNLTAMTVATARKLGIRVDEGIARAQLKAIAAYVEANRERYLQGISVAGGGDTTGYILLGLAAEGWPSDPATDAMARYLKGRQRANGSWRNFGGRPPIESSDIQCTATAMRAIQIYMPAPQRAEYNRAVQLAAEWIRTAQPVTTEDRAFQLFGLVWAGNQEMARPAAGSLLQEQRPDGGWSQTPLLPSDAYATGQALAALYEAGVPTSEAALKRGAQFLMNTQLEDGSWYVRSRTLPFQPYFDGGFPYGSDQFISAAATNWATIALAHFKATAADAQ